MVAPSSGVLRYAMGERTSDVDAAPEPEEAGGEIVDPKGLAVDASALLRVVAATNSGLGNDVLGDGVRQLDASQGPVDLGYPLLIDLGAGHAPYDDGVAPLDALDLGRSGFSDSVMRFTWREWVSPAAAFTGGAAFLRSQDSTILEGLSDGRVGFVVLGIQFRL